MLTRKTDLTGVVRVNRGIPERLKNETLDSKQSSFMRNNDVLAVKYEDRKPVHSLSTRYTAEVIEKTKPFQKKYTSNYSHKFSFIMSTWAQWTVLTNS